LIEIEVSCKTAKSNNVWMRALMQSDCL